VTSFQRFCCPNLFLVVRVDYLSGASGRVGKLTCCREGRVVELARRFVNRIDALPRCHVSGTNIPACRLLNRTGKSSCCLMYRTYKVPRRLISRTGKVP
jgi:hypothetical protein